jgi:hypothetical protein
MHQVKKATGQLRGIIGTRCHVSRIDISPGELLVHMAGGLLVLETVIGARADALQADWLGWQEDHIVQEGKPGSGAEGLQEPRADHAVVDDRVPAGGQSSCRRTGGFGNDLVLAISRGGPGRNVALVDECEELVPRYYSCRFPVCDRATAQRGA